MQDKKVTTVGAASETMDCGKLETSGTMDTTDKTLAEIIGLCNEVIAGDKDVDDTFFSTKSEASRLKAACEKGNVGEVLNHLRSYRGEPNPARLIKRIEACLANENKKATETSMIIEKKIPGASTEKLECGKAVTENTTANAPTSIVRIPAGELKAHPLVKDFYPIDPDVLSGITMAMKERGYDPRFPIQVCMEGDNKYLVWDGLTRMKAAIEAGIRLVPIMVSTFDSGDDLMEAVISTQNRRRNRTVQVLLVSVEKLIDIAKAKALSNQGRRNDLVTSGQHCPEVETGGANEYIAKMIGMSATTVKSVRKVSGNPEYRTKVLAGEMSVHKAYQEIMDAEKSKSPGVVAKAPAEVAPAPDRKARAMEHLAVQAPSAPSTELDDDKDEVNSTVVHDEIDTGVIGVTRHILGFMVRAMSVNSQTELKRLFPQASTEFRDFVLEILQSSSKDKAA